jgi:hypothetical protein
MASGRAGLRVLCSTPPRTDGLKRLRKICIGTLPGRKPGNRTCRPNLVQSTGDFLL